MGRRGGSRPYQAKGGGENVPFHSTGALLRLNCLAWPPSMPAMHKRSLFVYGWLATLLSLSLCAQEPDTAPLIRSKIDPEYSSLQTIYQDLHTHPELSHHEEKTAAKVAAELTRAGFEVTTHVGGHGVVG